MAKRVAILKSSGGGNYFAAPKTSLQFIPSGCKTFDLALGGGWVENRIINVVGDKSTGKTLLAIEGTANFARKYPKGKIRYRECEAAFDIPYAKTIGMPVDRVDFGDALETVEDFFEDLEKVVAGSRGPEFYIVDSLDALSDRAELLRSMDEGSYGAEKAKKLSQMFRRLVRKMETKQVTLMIISQVRDKIGVSFGRKTTRSGGRALDFYASQVAYLANLGTIARKVSNISRPSGVNVRAKLDKNKVGLPFREAAFPIMFGYGIDDVTACLEWLKEIKALKEVDILEKEVKGYSRMLMNEDAAYEKEETNRIRKVVEKRWYEIEQSLLPVRTKYGA